MHPAERKQNMQRLQRELKHLKEEPVPGVHAMVCPSSLLVLARPAGGNCSAHPRDRVVIDIRVLA
jgi:hypothetical protein